MSDPLAPRMGLGERELVAFTGAGGKSTLMLALAKELAETGQRVLVTTTTKMGRDQFAGIRILGEAKKVTTALSSDNLVALVTGGDDRKVTGPRPGVVDELFRSAPVDYLLVEADGAHGRSLKAPAVHEPVIPQAATMVVILMGIDAVDGRLADVAHRPGQAAALTGLGMDDRLQVEHCVAVITHTEGGLKGVPAAARVVVALTKTANHSETASLVCGRLVTHERISQVVLV